MIRPDEQHRELVAAQSRAHVMVTDRAAQPLGDRHQQLIADRVPERVVDQLESVQIHEQHGHRLTAAVAAHQLVLQAIKQHPAVRQAGQRVGQRLAGRGARPRDRDDYANVLGIRRQQGSLMLGPVAPGGR
jgi:hypothetical protein